MSTEPSTARAAQRSSRPAAHSAHRTTAAAFPPAKPSPPPPAASRPAGSSTPSARSTRRSDDRSALLTACHTNSLAVADTLGAKTVAFPAISTGIFGWPIADAARIAIAAITTTASNVEEVRFVLFDDAAYEVFRRATQP